MKKIIAFLKDNNRWKSIAQAVRQNKAIARKAIAFLKENNRWKYLAAGIGIGLCASQLLGGIYAAAVAASCLKLKDRIYAGKWRWTDFTDWLLTVAGGVAGALAWL